MLHYAVKKITLTTSISKYPLYNTLKPFTPLIPYSTYIFQSQPISPFRFQPHTLTTKPFSTTTTTTTVHSSATTTTTVPMSSTHITLTDETKFETTVKISYDTAKTNHQQLWIYITGAIVPETGRSWCPDCTSASPNMKKLSEASGHYVIECPVERLKYKGIPQDCDSSEGGCTIQRHPYKTDPKLCLTAIPTLFKVNMNDFDAPYDKLVESDVYNDTKFKNFTGLE